MMDSKKIYLTCDIKLSWWLIYLYIPMLVLFAKMCWYLNNEAEPNWDKVEKVIKKGIKLKNMRTTYGKS